MAQNPGKPDSNDTDRSDLLDSTRRGALKLAGAGIGAVSAGGTLLGSATAETSDGDCVQIDFVTGTNEITDLSTGTYSDSSRLLAYQWAETVNNNTTGESGNRTSTTDTCTIDTGGPTIDFAAGTASVSYTLSSCGGDQDLLLVSYRSPCNGDASNPGWDPANAGQQTVYDTATATTQSDGSLTVDLPPSLVTPYGLDAGGSQTSGDVTVDGLSYDRSPTDNQFVSTTGTEIAPTDPDPSTLSYSGTDNDLLYASEIGGFPEFEITAEIADGVYEVTLHLSEWPYFDDSQVPRLSNVYMEGEQVLERFEHVRGEAQIRIFDVPVVDNQLDIDFEAHPDSVDPNSKVNGVRIREASTLALPYGLDAGGSETSGDVTIDGLTYDRKPGDSTFVSSDGSPGALSDPDSADFANTSNDLLYASELFGSSFTVDIDLPVGTYDVTLYFSDFEAVSGRLQDVSIEGDTILERFECLSGQAQVETVPGVRVTDGTLNIGLESHPDSADPNAKINGVRVSPRRDVFFQVSNLLPSGVLGEPGDTFDTSATVTNIGDVTDQQTIEALVDNSTADSQSVSVDPVNDRTQANRETVSFTGLSTSSLSTGEYQYAITSDDDQATAPLYLTNNDTTRSTWNQGTLDGTSADRDDESGRLGLGYVSGGSTPSSTTQPLSSLVGQWRLDETYGTSSSGDTVTDYSGNGYDGTTRNVVDTQVSGPFSTTAYDLSGEDGSGNDTHVEVTDNVFDATQGVSFAFWYKLVGTTGGGANGYITDRNDTTNDWSLQVWASDNNQQVQLLVSDGAGNDTVATTADSVINKDQWHFIVVTYDPNNNDQGTIYVDGDQKSQDTASLSATNVNSGLSIGSYFDNSTWGIPGEFAEVMVFEKVLSQSEVTNLYLNGSDGTYNGSYTSDTVSESSAQSWNSVDTAALVPTNTAVDMVFEVSDDGFSTVKDSQTISLAGGLETSSLSVQNATDARVRFDGTSTDVETTWEIKYYEINYTSA